VIKTRRFTVSNALAALGVIVAVLIARNATIPVAETPLPPTKTATVTPAIFTPLAITPVSTTATVSPPEVTRPPIRASPTATLSPTHAPIAPTLTATKVLPTSTVVPPSQTMTSMPTRTPTQAGPDVSLTNETLIGSGVKIEQQAGGAGLRIVMLDPDGRPWANTYFEVYEQTADVSGNPTRGKRAKSGYISQQGLIDFEIAAGKYGVCTSTSPGYNWATSDCVYDVQVTSGKLTTVQLQAGQIEVVVLGADGNPWKDVYFAIYTQKRDVSGNPVIDRKVTGSYTDNSGLGRFWLTPGMYIVSIDLRGYNWGKLREAKGETNIAVQKGETNRVTIRMGRLVVGLKKPNGDPNTDVYVKVCTQKPAVDGKPVIDSLVWSGYTDNGGFAAVDLTQGQYALQIGDVVLWNVPVEGGRVTTSDGKTIK